MLKYLIIHLDDTSTSFCHYANDKSNPRLIALDTLKDAIFWSMKENLSVQVAFPDYPIPAEYHQALERVGHADIVSSRCEDKQLLASADVVVFNSWTDMWQYQFNSKQVYAIRTTYADFIAHEKALESLLPAVSRINIIFTDVEQFSDSQLQEYSQALDNLANVLVGEYAKGNAVQLNLLTDRLLLDKMNNCNAGSESITLAPDGKLYICPANYLEGDQATGDASTGPDIKNPQLYHLDHAPICRICDAWQCKRCTWLNRRLTLEVNTPGHQQCIIAHVERNASRNMLARLRTLGQFLPDKEIAQLDYNDPFDKLINNNQE